MISEEDCLNESRRLAEAAQVALTALGYDQYQIEVELEHGPPRMAVVVQVRRFTLCRLYWLLSGQEPARIEHFIRRYLGMLEAPNYVGTLQVAVELRS